MDLELGCRAAARSAGGQPPHQKNKRLPKEPLAKVDMQFSAWRTEVRDERPSDRTAESHKAETLAAQGFAGLGK